MPAFTTPDELNANREQISALQEIDAGVRGKINEMLEVYGNNPELNSSLANSYLCPDETLRKAYEMSPFRKELLLDMEKFLKVTVSQALHSAGHCLDISFTVPATKKEPVDPAEGAEG